MTDEAQFTVALRRRDGRWRWVVTCERCNADLSDDYGTGVVLLKVRGFSELIASDPEAAERVSARLREIWDVAARTRRPMVCDAEDFSAETVATRALELVIETHADACGDVV